jgi:hypothetical protein
MPTVTLSSHVDGLAALTNATIDNAADKLLIHDDSAGANKYVLPKHVGTGKHTVNLLAAGMIVRTTSGPSKYETEKATNDVMVSGYGFDAATDEALQVMLPLPKGYNSTGTLTATFYWSSASTAGTGDVVWGCRAKFERNDDTIDAAYGTAQTVTDSFIADGDMHITSATSAITPGGTHASGAMLNIEVYRDANAGGDTYTQDALLLAVLITLPYDANTDD